MSNFALISIHPSHIDNIVSGKKFFEYRKVLPKGTITHLVLYSTAPIMKVVAVVEVTSVIVGSPSKVWDSTAYGSGISRQFFRQYFSGQKTATAFELGKVFVLQVPMELKQLRENKTPPQSFCYLDNSSIEKLSNWKFIERLKPDMIFMGGVHGVGKSTKCKDIFRPAGYQCVTASNLLASYEEPIKTDKKVSNVARNQEIILQQLNSRKDKYPRLLLDGHFTLVNQKGNIEPIEITVFQNIQPSRLILLKETPKIIAERLKVRDAKKWDTEFLTHFQEQEELHARLVSHEIGVPLEVFTNSNSDVNRIKRTVHWRYLE